MDDTAAWEGAGLYDPAAPGAEGRRALLEYLRERGAPLDEMVRYDREGRLPSLAGALVRREHRTMSSPADLERAGVVDYDTYARIWRSAGLPVLERDEPGLTDLDAEALASYAVAAAVFGEDETIQFTRVMGAALASIAEAATVLFGLTVGGTLVDANATELEYATAVESSARMLVDAVPGVMRALFMQHIDRAVDRYAAGGDVGAQVAQLAVGFIDLVESTPLVHELSPDALASAFNDFEQHATEVVTAHHGRVVKTIGDEVMFIATTPESAALIATELVEYTAAHPALPAVRGGLAWGPLVRGYADYYGPVVHLAARAAKAARPGEVVAEPELVAQLRDVTSVAVGDARAHDLRGFGAPVLLAPLERVHA